MSTMKKTSALISRAAAQVCGAALPQALDTRLMLLPFTPGATLEPTDLASIEVAFMSSDIVGTSSRTEPTPAMQAFCDILDAAPNLRWLQLSMAGVDRAIFPRLAARGVRITTAAGAASTTVAITALTGLLALSRRVPLWLRSQQQKAWRPQRTGSIEPRELTGQRVLIVGTGRVGCEFARLCKAVGLVTHGLSHGVRLPLPDFDHIDLTEDLPEVVHEADWVVATCPLTDETRGLFHRGIFSSFKPTASFINVARGGVANEADLIEALASGSLESAYLDVFEVEPLPVESPLWDMENVLMSAHSAGDTTGRHARLGTLFMDNLARYLADQPLINEVESSLLLSPR